MTDVPLGVRLPAAHESQVQRMAEGAELHAFKQNREIEARAAQQHQHGQAPYQGLDVADVVKQRVFHVIIHVRVKRQSTMANLRAGSKACQALSILLLDL